jgi:hypothetical protein
MLRRRAHLVPPRLSRGHRALHASIQSRVLELSPDQGRLHGLRKHDVFWPSLVCGKPSPMFSHHLALHEAPSRHTADLLLDTGPQLVATLQSIDWSVIAFRVSIQNRLSLVNSFDRNTVATDLAAVGEPTRTSMKRNLLFYQRKVELPDDSKPRWTSIEKLDADLSGAHARTAAAACRARLAWIGGLPRADGWPDPVGAGAPSVLWPARLLSHHGGAADTGREQRRRRLPGSRVGEPRRRICDFHPDRHAQRLAPQTLPARRLVPAHAGLLAADLARCLIARSISSCATPTFGRRRAIAARRVTDSHDGQKLWPSP